MGSRFTNAYTTRCAFNAQVLSLRKQFSLTPIQRPFDGRSQDSLSDSITKTQPKYDVTNPAVSVPCLRAMAALMEKDRTKRIGAASWESFTSHLFFAPLDFVALERREIPAVFKPSSEKTNFDATYDLEELLLEEAPLEARARRQKPRAGLREDATPKEIREDELYRLIENMFEAFDYTRASRRGYVSVSLLGVSMSLLTFALATLPRLSRQQSKYSRHFAIFR